MLSWLWLGLWSFPSSNWLLLVYRKAINSCRFTSFCPPCRPPFSVYLICLPFLARRSHQILLLIRFNAFALDFFFSWYEFYHTCPLCQPPSWEIFSNTFIFNLRVCLCGMCGLFDLDLVFKQNFKKSNLRLSIHLFMQQRLVEEHRGELNQHGSWSSRHACPCGI